MQSAIRNKIILCVLFWVVVLAGIVHADGITLEPTIEKTVIPGNYVPLTVKITNTGAAALQDIDVTVHLPKVLDADGRDKTIVQLNPGQSVILSWNIQAENDAQTGYETIRIEAESATEDVEVKVPLLIKSIESSLEITRISTDPEQAAPGEQTKVTLTVKNHAHFTLQDIHLSLDLTTVPLAPLEGTEERIIPSLGDEDIRTISFLLETLPSAEGGIYKIPVIITYFDEFGERYTKTNTIALEIGAAPKVDLIIEGNSIQGQRGDLTLRIINKGLIPIQFLSVTVNHPAILSPHNLYLGDLDPDDFQTEKITVLSEETITLPLTLEFKDANNHPHTLEKTITIPVLDQATAKKAGLIPSSRWPYVFFVMVIGGIFYLFRRRKKQKKQ